MRGYPPSIARAKIASTEDECNEQRNAKLNFCLIFLSPISFHQGKEMGWGLGQSPMFNNI